MSDAGWAILMIMAFSIMAYAPDLIWLGGLSQPRARSVLDPRSRMGLMCRLSTGAATSAKGPILRPANKLAYVKPATNARSLPSIRLRESPAAASVAISSQMKGWVYNG